MSSRYFETAIHAKLYAQFRPSVPTQLIKKIIDFAKAKCPAQLQEAVDVGCGSGQSTRALSPYFKHVTGLDISQAQVNESIQLEKLNNVSYMVSGAENLPCKNSSVQLVTASQAVHWFDIPAFFKDVNRVLVPGGVLALYGYDFPSPIWGDKTKDLHKLVTDIYVNNLAKYFGKERQFVDNRLSDRRFNIPYSDFCRIDNIVCERTVTAREFQGYICSWSGFQNYKIEHGEDAARGLITKFLDDLMAILDVSSSPEDTKFIIRFPMFLLMGSKPLE